MSQARHERERFNLILDRWINGGGYAYLVLLELYGKRGVDLSTVIKTSNGLGAPFSGKAWTGRVEKYQIVGKPRQIKIARSKTDRWIVRKWIILATTRELGNDERDELETNFARRWNRAVESSAQVEQGRVFGPRSIPKEEAAAVAQFITEAYSPLPRDAPIEPYAESLTVETGLRASDEYSPSQLAARYREYGGLLEPQFAVFGKESSLQKPNGRFGIKRNHDSPRTRLLDVPEECLDYMEYSWGIHKVRMYSAEPNQATKPASRRWNAIIKRSQAVRLRAPADGWRSPRSTKK